MQPRRGTQLEIRHGVHDVARARPATVPTRVRRAGQRRRGHRADVGGSCALRPARTSSSSGSTDLVEHRVGQPARRERPRGRARAARHDCLAGARRAAPAAPGRRSPTARVRRDRSVWRPRSPASCCAARWCSRSRRKARTGWRRNRSSWSRPIGSRRVGRRAGCSRNGGPRCRGARRGLGAGQMQGVEAPRTARAPAHPARSSGGRTAGAGARPRRRPGPPLRPRARCDPRRRAARRPGTAGGRGRLERSSRPGVGDDEVIARRQQCVEQQLAILAAHVAVADPRVARRQVVAVPLDVPGEAPVVQAEQADHPVRDRAHRHQRADGQVPGTEVRPGRPALETVGHDRAHVVAAESRPRSPPRRPWPRPRARRAARSVGPVARRRAVTVAVSESAMRASVLGPRHRPSRTPARGSSALRRRSTNSATRPASSMSPLSTSSSGSAPPKSRWRSSAIATPRSIRSRPACHVLAPMPSSWNAPRWSASKPQRTNAPSTHSSSRNRSSSLKRNRRRTGSRPARSSTSVAVIRRGEQLEDLGQHAHHRVGLPERPVGQSDLERRPGSSDRVVVVVPAERRLDERGEVLDVGTHDDDVAGLEGRIVLEEVQDGVAQHLDLTAPAVTRVHPDAVVVGLEQGSLGRHRRRRGRRRRGRRACRPGCGASSVGAAVAGRRRSSASPCGTAAPSTSCISAGVAAPGRQERVARHAAVGSSAPERRRGTSARRRRPAGPTERARGATRRGARRAPRPSPRARRGSWPAAGSGRTGTGGAAGRAARLGLRSAAQARRSRSAGLGRPMRSRSDRHSSTCHDGLVLAAARPSAQRCSMSGRCTA